MKKIIVSLSLVMLTTGTNAYADDSYLGVSYHMGSYEETGFPEVNPSGITLKAGKYVAPNFAFEGHASFGVGSDSISYMGTNVDLSIKHAISVFAKGELPLSDAAHVYGLIGATKGKLEASVMGFTISNSDSGLSYGFGAEAKIGDGMYISGEYIMYLSESTYDYSGINFGISKRF